MRKTTVLAASLILGTAGCGGQTETMETVPLDRLPPGALDLAKRELPDVKFESARKGKYEGQDSIEIRGRNKEGKIREVESDLTGKVLEVE